MPLDPRQPSQQQPDPIIQSGTGQPDVGSGSRITIVVAAAMDLLRSALASLLSGQDGIEVVAAVKTADALAATAVRLRPSVIVVDVDRWAPRVMSTLSQLRARLPQTQIVALTAAKPAGLVQRLLAADVLGVVDKNAPAARLVEAIRAAARGEPAVDVTLAVAALAVAPNPLTRRELEVLQLAADGADGPQIAERLHLSPGTVRNYLSKVISKTGARSRIDAVRIAREAGWI